MELLTAGYRNLELCNSFQGALEVLHWRYPIATAVFYFLLQW